MTTQFIEVMLDGNGELSYRLRPTSYVTTKVYGEILATLVHQIAHMMVVEGEAAGKRWTENEVYMSIVRSLMAELDQPTAAATVSASMLQ